MLASEVENKEDEVEKKDQEPKEVPTKKMIKLM